MRRTFCSVYCVQAKKFLYLSPVRSQFMYCSPVWRPHFIKDILSIETVQRRATKYILNDISSDYKSRLTNLNFLPLMMQLEINDIIFFIKNLKPSSSFDIRSFVHFCSNTTRSSTYLKLKHASPKLNCVRHFYFNRLPRLWNSLPCIDIDKSLPVIKKDLHSLFWENFIATFNPVIPCTFHYVCPCAKCVLLPVTFNFLSHILSLYSGFLVFISIVSLLTNHQYRPFLHILVIPYCFYCEAQ